MIAECLIFMASFAPPVVNYDNIMEYKYCSDIVPEYPAENFKFIQQHFEPINWDVAVRISWCESRGNENALRTAEGNNDSGLFQFVSWTWNWIADEYHLPRWGEWVILHHGQPYVGPTSRSSYGFEQMQVQYSPYYNTLFASLLAEDIYDRVQFRDWSSSEWCWGSTKKFIKLVAKEKSM